MKSVLISIKPEYCELIAAGKKTIEVRKTRPKISTPFKCYIYCTLPKERISIGQGNYACSDNLYLCNNKVKFGEGFEDIGKETISLNGKVIGEFVCDSIDKIHVQTDLMWEYDIAGFSERTINILNNSCLSYDDMINYSGCSLDKYNPRKEYLYGWHISDLIIYDKPKELSEFYTLCSEYKREHITSKCGRCRHISFNEFDRCLECDCKGEKKLTRPPQSWCYVDII